MVWNGLDLRQPRFAFGAEGRQMARLPLFIRTWGLGLRLMQSCLLLLIIFS